jgi:hypothetical protein
MISTERELVEQLGGVRAVSKLVGVSETAVRMSYNRGIPARWHMRLYQETQRRKIKVSPELLGLSQERN